MEAAITKDFADWLSPMLVKEMRQGMRGRIFVAAFLLIQTLMIFCVIMSIVDADGSFGNSSEFFWTMIGLPLLLIMPARGFGTLGGEIKDNTLELIYLTRLSSWRIVVGKWSAIVAQTLLLACSVLPYVVLRYFLGGINLLDDLTALCWMLVCSALLTAIAVALSPFQRSLLARIFFSFGPLIFIWVAIVLLESRVFGGGVSPSSSESSFAALVLGPLFLFLMFEIAVTRIAPPAENHSFRIRLLGILILAAIGVLNHFSINPGLLRGTCIFLLLPICITALCEEAKPIPSIYLPFVKRGFPGRLAGLIFYPGWVSGLLYSALAYAAFLFIFFDRKTSIDSDFLLLQVAFVGTMIFPLAVEKVCFGRFKKTFPIYLGLQSFMLVVMVLASPLKDSRYPEWMRFASPLPTSVLFLKLFNRIEDHYTDFFLLVSVIVTMLALFLLLAMMPRQWRQIRAWEKEARDDLMKPETPEIAHADAA